MKNNCCNYCGEKIDMNDCDNLIQAVDGSIFCSGDCAWEAGYNYCDDCGEWISDFVITGSGTFCLDCVENNGYHRCNDCGEWVSENRIQYSEICGEYFCLDCFSETFAFCAECGDEIYLPDGDYFCNEYGDFYCLDCKPCEFLHSYGYTPTLHFWDSAAAYSYSATPRRLYMGVELETDDGRDVEDFCNDLVKFDNARETAFWLTEDASLNDGVEITTQPMTLSAHCAAGLFEHVATVARRYNFVSHDAGTCGMHIHVSRAYFGASKQVQAANLFKLVLLTQRFKNQLERFARRSDSRWAKFPAYPFDSCGNVQKNTRGEIYITKKPQNLEAAARWLENEYSIFNKGAQAGREMAFHTSALNCSPCDTVEFRLWRGTLNVNTIFATLAMTDGLCRAAKMHGTTWAKTVTWYDFCEWMADTCTEEKAATALLDYLIKRGLWHVEECEQEQEQEQERETEQEQGGPLPLCTNLSQANTIVSILENGTAVTKIVDALHRIITAGEILNNFNDLYSPDRHIFRIWDISGTCYLVNEFNPTNQALTRYRIFQLEGGERILIGDRFARREDYEEYRAARA